jgi:methionine-S-sulfoxide reductase
MSLSITLRHVAAALLAATVTSFAAPPIPPPSVDASLAKQPGKQTAVFAGGCFWGVQSVFQRVKGVLRTTAGYSGGSANTATYGQVRTETTDHAESVEVVFDPSRITYGQLLRIYFSVAHDPTRLNRQGNDVGTSYRSAIFFTTDEQAAVGQGLYRGTRRAKSRPEGDRNRSHASEGLLSRRRLSSGLRLLQSKQPVYSGLRSS